MGLSEVFEELKYFSLSNMFFLASQVIALTDWLSSSLNECSVFVTTCSMIVDMVDMESLLLSSSTRFNNDLILMQVFLGNPTWVEWENNSQQNIKLICLFYSPFFTGHIDQILKLRQLTLCSLLSCLKCWCQTHCACLICCRRTLIKSNHARKHFSLSVKSLK